MKIVVTGGKGLLGTEVVRRLEGRGATVTSASRRTGVDLGTGAGIEAALAGADCVVHAATHRIRHRRVDLDGTGRMIKILADRSAPPHVIYISIVGCDRIPQRYYRVKYACELALERSLLPVTVVRATQFHALVDEIARVATVGRLALVAEGMSFQPCDHHWIAAELADIAFGSAPSGFVRAADRAGPEHVTLAGAVDLIRAKHGKSLPRLITLPALGGTLGAYQAGANLPDADAKIGGASFREFLRR
jgi:uncharacterized protein YbjT (DUF2867 family)